MHFQIYSWARTLTIAAVMALAFTAACETGPDLTNVNKTKSPDAKASPREQELAGVYSIEGADDTGGGVFTGSLTVTNQNDAYRFTWQTTRGKYNGTGIQMSDAVAVVYAEPEYGKDCGVVLFKIASDGSLDGRIAMWGEDKFGDIRATQSEGRNFDGKYSVAGRRPDGVGYAGQMAIKKDGSGYDFAWVEDYEAAPTRSVIAFGTWKGSFAAASFGGRQCNFALYSVQSNGDLEGSWGGQKAVTFGTETAKRQ